MVAGMEQQGRVFLGRRGEDFDEAHLEVLADKGGFGDLVAEVDMESSGDRMDPDASLDGGGEVFDSFDEDAAVCFGGLDEAADVDVEVALGAGAFAVIGEAPAVAELFGSETDGLAPELVALGLGEVAEVVGGRAVSDWQDEPAAGLAGVDVLEDKELLTGRAFFGFEAEAALAGLHRLGVFGVTGALGDVGSQQSDGDKQQQHYGESHCGHYTGGCPPAV
jgi:hypothetical protein